MTVSCSCKSVHVGKERWVTGSCFASLIVDAAKKGLVIGMDLAKIKTRSPSVGH
jgi:hypothetical protein